MLQFSSAHRCHVLIGLNIPWNSLYLDLLQRTVGQETYLIIPYIYIKQVYHPPKLRQAQSALTDVIILAGDRPVCRRRQAGSPFVQGLNR
jgi:hypothetical protein